MVFLNECYGFLEWMRWLSKYQKNLKVSLITIITIIPHHRIHVQHLIWYIPHLIYPSFDISLNWYIPQLIISLNWYILHLTYPSFDISLIWYIPQPSKSIHPSTVLKVDISLIQLISSSSSLIIIIIIIKLTSKWCNQHFNKFDICTPSFEIWPFNQFWHLLVTQFPPYNFPLPSLSKGFY